MGSGEQGGPRARGRDAFEAQAWRESFAHLSEADRLGALEPEDLERLAMAAYLIGRDNESREILAHAHRACLSLDEHERAVRCAFWLGFQLVTRGDVAQAGGWFERGQRLIEDENLDCVEAGYLLVPVALRSLFGGDAEAALEIFDEIDEIAGRFSDHDLKMLGGLGRGQALNAQGKIEPAAKQLDEVMVAVTNGEVSPILAGIAYCAVIDACHEAFDLRRAFEWTEALSRWCDSQPDLVPYRGQCLVHRAQIMQLHGEWPEALREAEAAREQLFDAPDQVAVGMAFYQVAELQRLSGAFTDAEDSFRQASEWGREPQPGLAMLRLAQDQVPAAEASIRRVMNEAHDVGARAKLLPEYVEIMLASGDAAAARAGADELTSIAGDLGAPLLQALAAYARGAVEIASGSSQGALADLRDAWALWQKLEAPYQIARTRLLIGAACEALGDRDGARLELDAARGVFERLGAESDLARADELFPETSKPTAGGLTGREVEVLAQVATGKSNREIAEVLVVSEKTVARHMSNIFVKLDVPSRAAATAYAFKHNLA